MFRRDMPLLIQGCCITELKEVTGRSSTPTPAVAPVVPSPSPPPSLPSDGNSAPIPRTGLLTVRVIDARSLGLPPGAVLPNGIAKALAEGGEAAATAGKNRDSVGGRRTSWWLP